LSLIACPECGLPAEIGEHFWLGSTEGPVEHVAVSCVAGHYFRMALDRLPVTSQPRPGSAAEPSLRS
jgi:hypothetical protein